MNKIVIILLTSFFLASCGTNHPKNYILLSGTISNAPTKKFTLGGNGSPITITLDKNDSFSDTITNGTGHYIFFNSRNRADLYLTNGGTYNFTADGNDFKKTSKLTGTDPDASNYLITKFNNISKIRGDYTEFNSLNETDFIAKETMIKENLIKYLDSFPNIPKGFEETEREELHYYHLKTLIKYENLHRKYAEQPDFKVSANFLKELEGLDYLNEKSYRLRSSYYDIVKEHFRIKAEELTKNEGIDRHLAKLKVFGAITNDYIKNSLLMSAASNGITFTNNLDEYYNTYISVSTSKSNDKNITKKYENLKKLSKGQPSPAFTDYVNHAEGTTSLSDFKGKYVYIDVWATWCGPCLAEVPSLKKVEKQYHGKNIEFVSISIDVEKMHDAWRKMVVDKELSGVQLLADKAWGSSFIKGYQISGIPRFILIDPKGNIVNANAPRPSKSELITLFNELGI